MNVTEASFKTYLEVFHRTLKDTAQQFLAPEYVRRLWYLAFLPAQITGFVSTEFGVAMDYAPEHPEGITVKVARNRIEDVVVSCPAALRSTQPILRVEGRGWRFVGINLSGSFPFRLIHDESNIAFHQCIFDAGEWQQSVYYLEVWGDRKQETWTSEKAIARAKDMVLAALVDVKYANAKQLPIDKYVTRVKEKSVLLLGDYSSESQRLDQIRKELLELAYNPIVVKDVPDHPHMDLAQKVTLLGNMCRFVIIEDSTKSGHLLEVQLCKSNQWVTVILRERGNASSWMTAGISHASNIILEHTYEPGSLNRAVQRVVGWAENKLNELQRRFNATYPWRIEHEQ